MGIAQNIERLRKKNNLTQKELSEKLNVSNKTVSSWEIGRTEPNIGMIESMCAVFNCTKSELLEESWGNYKNQITQNLISGNFLDSVSADAMEIAILYDQLDPGRKGQVKGYIDCLIEQSRLVNQKKEA